VTKTPEKKTTPDLRFETSDDSMQVRMFCRIRPAKPYSMEEVEEELYRVNIIYGIQYEKIESLIEQVNQGSEEVMGEVVAEGEAAIRGQDAGVDLKFSNSSDDPSEVMRVRRGAILASITPGAPARHGLRVSGEMIPGDLGGGCAYQAGKYCKFDEEEGVFIAQISGFAELSDDLIISIKPAGADEGEEADPFEKPQDSQASSPRFSPEQPEDQPPLQFFVAPDFMSAYMVCYPREGEPFGMEEIEEQLYSLSIIHGIDYDKIEELIKKVNDEGLPILGEKIAVGDAPVLGVPMRVKYRVDVDPSLLGNIADRSLDSPSNWVYLGDVIATILPPVKGKFGLQVTGEALLLPDPQDEEVVAGKNCYFDEKVMGFVAEVDGEAALSDEGVLSVFAVEVQVQESKNDTVRQRRESTEPVLSLEVTDNEMMVLLSCQPKTGCKVLMEEVEEALYAQDVIHGIEYEKIESLLETVNSSGVGFNSETIAIGERPINGNDEILTLYFTVDLSPDQNKIRVGENRFSSNRVENSDVLATLSPITPPRFGLTVKGKNIVGEQGNKISLDLGRACSYEAKSREVIARDSGMVTFVEGRIEVKPVAGVSIKAKSEKAQSVDLPMEVLPESPLEVQEQPTTVPTVEESIASQKQPKLEPILETPEELDLEPKPKSPQVEPEFAEQGEVQDSIDVELSLDEMAVALTLHPRQDQPWSLEEVEDRLYKKDIVFGIEYEKIQELVRLVNDGDVVTREIVACGEPVIDGVDESLTLYFSKEVFLELDNTSDPDLLSPESYWDQCLQVGDPVAKFHPISPSKAGLSVTGRKIEGHQGRKSIYHLGDHCVLDKTTAVFMSTIEGQVVQKGAGLLDIEPVRFIEGDVCLATGDIFSDGKVVITGNILSGLKVVAEGDVMILGRVEIASVTSGRHIFARGGIQGGVRGKKARIQAKGRLEAKFCNNALVHCKGSVTVDHSILHCDIECSGFLKVVEGKGIVGGKIQAAEGIDTTCLGSPLGIPTEVSVGGYNYEIKKEILRIEGKRKRLSKKITELSVRLRPYRGQDLDDLPLKIGQKMRELRRKLEMLLKQDRDHACLCDDLKSKLKSKEEMIVTVTQTVYPDVRIQVENSILQGLYEPIHKCIFQEHATRSAVEYYPILTDEEKNLMESAKEEKDVLEPGMIR
jgi:uncharacterized protein